MKHDLEEAWMTVRRLTLALVLGSFAVAAAAPAFADEGWRRHERHEWRDHVRREHEWREHEWRERHWRERNYAPPYMAAPGYYAPPPVYYGSPGYYR
jgi:hypothetical protein